MISTIVAGVIKTDTARDAGARAIELANQLGATLHLVSCVDEVESGPEHVPVAKHTRAFLESLATRAKLGAQVHVMPGDPVEAILHVAEEQDADLIVVGNKGMKGVRRVLGSVPNAISHRAPCSVLIVSTT